MKENILRMENIEKWFGKVHALRGVDFSVDEGEVVGLVGENGAGKSTLIKIISGLYLPDTGKIYWRGKEVEIDSVKRARELGIETVHQSRLTIDTLDISENIFLAREIKKSIGPIKIIDKIRQNERSVQLTSELGLGIESPEQEVRLCSGAEKQGIEVARALQFKAELLILDEPTVGLTIEGIDQLRRFIHKVTKKGTGCIFITHNFRHILDLADRFVIITRGNIVAQLPNEYIDVEKIEELILK